MIYYIKENGYWEDPSDVLPEGASEVPQRPSPFYDWNSQEQRWVLNEVAEKERCCIAVEKEFRRICKFNFLPTEIYASISTDLDSYREQLRNYVKGWQGDSIQPECPASLTEENFYAL